MTPLPKKIARALQHLRLTTPTHILHDLPLDDDDRLLVVGDPDNACYEWCLITDSSNPLLRSMKASDCAYGRPTVALRDGLVKYHGLPANLEYLFPELPTMSIRSAPSSVPSA